eukprot:TRINITY_DN742_c0_g1_i2.p1 TRINITY_DN742_c0_g1~~TRINITY_DN742_c0_g1_i2.p1  ORF type:complete len:971 (+),score=185.39 TRINITY_DN742_c0_g1_i2:925-3837(+)
MLSGEIPKEIGHLSNLTYLYLLENKLSGELPEEIGQLANLVHLELALNNLSGILPPQICNLTKLEQLIVAGNAFRGNIPSCIGELENLVELYLSLNGFDGLIPSSLGNLKKLVVLQLSITNVEGPIPPSLGELGNLRQMHLFSNRLNGSIPKELGKLCNLSQLYLHHNKLSGPIPSTLGDLSLLEKLHLDSNQLEGQIPSSLGNLSQLTELILSGNQFSGNLPESFKNMKKLTTFLLQRNRIEDISSLYLPTSVMYFSISGNEIKTFRPDFVQDHALAMFDISQNDFSGRKIPSEYLPSKTVSLSLTDTHIAIEPDLLLEEVFDKGVLESTQYASHLDFSGTHIRQLFPSDYSERIPLVRSLSIANAMPGSLDEFALSDKHFIERLGETLPFLVDLDISGNRAISGTCDDFQNTESLQHINLLGTSLSCSFNSASPLGIEILPTSTHPGSHSDTCFDIMGRNGTLQIEIEDNKFGHVHCFCDDGYYGLSPTCKLCLPHAHCDGISKAELQYVGFDARSINGRIRAERGYWATPSYSLQQIDDGMYPTHMLACRGAGTSETPCDDDGRGNKCTHGHEGRMCDRCEDNYYRVFPTCFGCPSVVGRVLFAIGSGLGWLVLIGLSFVFGSGGNASIKILLFHIQGLSLIRPPMPSVGSQTTDHLNSVFGLSAAGAGCYFSGYGVKEDYVVSLITPIAFSLVIGLIFIVGVLFPKFPKWLSHRLPGPKLTWCERVVRSIIFLLFFGYMRTSQIILFPLICEEDPGTHDFFMLNAQSDKCSTAMQACSSILLLGYVIFLPSLVLSLILKRYDQHHQVFGILVAGYPRKFRFWEVLVAVRRVLFLSPFFLFPRSSQVGVLWVSIILLLSIVLQFLFRPYSTELENSMEIISLLTLLVNLSVRLGAERAVIKDGEGVKIAMLVINFAFVSILFTWIGKHLVRKMRALTRKFFGVITSRESEEMSEKFIHDDDSEEKTT